MSAESATTPTPAAAAASTDAPVVATPADAPLETAMADDNGLKRKAVDGAAGGGAARSGATGGGAERGRGGANKRGRGGRGGGGRGGGGNNYNRNNDAEEGSAAGCSDGAAAVAAVPAVPHTPIQQQFQLFANYLDQRNDRRESVYQASRDLTRASKKLISLLQRCTHSTPAERVKLLESARTQQLTELHHMLAATIADFKEEEYHRYAGAYSPGFQEFIESASLLHYLEHGTLLTHLELERDIEQTLGKRITIPLSDYIVGILDLGGELMRYATNSVTTGNRAIVSDICVFLRAVYAQYQQLGTVLPHGNGPYKELGKKMEVWMQSLVKIETLAYKLHIRGAEIPDAGMLSSMLLQEMSRGGGGHNNERDDGGEGRGGGDDE